MGTTVKQLILILYLFAPILINAAVSGTDLQKDAQTVKSKIVGKIVLAGNVLNANSTLPTVSQKMQQIGLYFDDYRLIFFENDSTDNTLELLRELEKQLPGKVVVISEPGLKAKIPVRTHRLAYCRNKVVQTINEKFKEFDYFIYMDMDEPILDLDVSKVCRLFDDDMIDQYDVATANSLPNYYDLWALRTDAFNKDCWEDGSCFKPPYLKKWFPDNPFVDGGTIDPKSSLIPVLSAFGAFGLYKIPKIVGCVDTYNGVGNCEGNAFGPTFYKEQCEHVPFHKCLREKNNARIVIVPFLTVRNGNSYVNWDKENKRYIIGGKPQIFEPEY